jgi:hypothetical protein
MTHTDEPILQSNSSTWRSLLEQARSAWHDTSLSTFLTGFILLFLFILFLALVQFSTPDMPDNDGFYHIKLAYLMRTEGLTPDFTWLPLTILNAREYYDHHFLFHVLLIPFTFGDLRLGAKWGAVIIAALAFLIVWWLLHRQRVPFAPLWALGLLVVSEAFIYRMSITRAQSLSLLLLVLSLHWLLTGKHLRMLLLGFLFVWTYNGFPLLLAVTGLYVASVWLLERRFDLRPLIYSGIGIAAGLIINPYFPHNIVFIVQHILPKVVDATSISVGNEWFPYTTAQILQNSPLALVAFLSGALALGLSRRRMDIRTATAYLLAVLFGLMLFQSRRFIEYFPPFALIFAAFAWSPVTAQLHTWFHHPGEDQQAVFVKQARAVLGVLLALVLLFVGMRANLEASQASIQRSKPYTTYAGSSAWLAANTPPGSRVFQTDWDDFPRLFYYNTHNTYLVGLDPTYMQLYNEALYERWVNITRGRVDLPAAAILDEFGARYVHSDLEHERFLLKAERDPRLVEVYRDRDSVLFEVVD